MPTKPRARGMMGEARTAIVEAITSPSGTLSRLGKYLTTPRKGKDRLLDEEHGVQKNVSEDLEAGVTDWEREVHQSPFPGGGKRVGAAPPEGSETARSPSPVKMAPLPGMDAYDSPSSEAALSGGEDSPQAAAPKPALVLEWDFSKKNLVNAGGVAGGKRVAKANSGPGLIPPPPPTRAAFKKEPSECPGAGAAGALPVRAPLGEVSTNMPARRQMPSAKAAPPAPFPENPILGRGEDGEGVAQHLLARRQAEEPVRKRVEAERLFAPVLNARDQVTKRQGLLDV